MRLGACTRGTEVRLAPPDKEHPLAGATAYISRAYETGDTSSPDTLACPFTWPRGAVLVILDDGVKWGCRFLTVDPRHLRPAPVLVDR